MQKSFKSTCRRFGALTGAALVFSGAGFAQSVVPPASDPAAIVNGEPISIEAVQKYAIEWRSYEVLQELIVAALIEQEARKVGVGVTDAEVDKEVSRQLEEYRKRLPEDKNLDEALNEVGAPMSRIRLRAKINLLGERIALAKFKPQDYVEVRTIIIRPTDTSLDALQKAIETSREAYTMLLNGAKFEEVKAKYDSDNRDPQHLGYLGWRDIGIFPEGIQKPLRAAKKGTIIEPTQTPFGIQIFYVVNTGAEASEQEIDALRGRYLEMALPQMVERLRESAKIEMIWPIRKSPPSGNGNGN
jgi:parvulin-like peptidyl-prolyl isomerase